MKYPSLLFASLALCCSTANSAPEAIYTGNALHIPYAVYKGAVYDVKMTFKEPGQLVLQTANPVSMSELENSAYSKVQVSDDLKFTLTNISVGGQIYRADVVSKEVASAAFDVTGITLVNENVTFSDSLNIAYYNLSNPKTGNDQLVCL